MKELDVLLEGYLATRYETASEAEQGAFRALLEAPDPLLFDYLTGRERPASEGLSPFGHALAQFMMVWQR